MTDELSPRARDIVDAACGADGPSDEDRRRVRSAVFAAIGAASLPTAAEAASNASPSAGSSAAGSAASTVGASAIPLVVKAMAVTAAVAAISVGAYLVSRNGERPAERAPRNVERRQALDVPDNRPAGAQREQPVKTPREPAPELSPEPEMEFEPDTVTSHPRAPSTISAERELLANARTAHQDGRSVEALSLLDDYARRFAGGKLLEERSVLRVLVLCDLGKTSLARREATAFLRRWPGSVQVERVRRSCAAGEAE